MTEPPGSVSDWNEDAAGRAVARTRPGDACGADIRPIRKTGEAVGGETGTPVREGRNPRPSGRGEVNDAGTIPAASPRLAARGGSDGQPGGPSPGHGTLGPARSAEPAPAGLPGERLVRRPPGPHAWSARGHRRGSRQFRRLQYGVRRVFADGRVLVGAVLVRIVVAVLVGTYVPLRSTWASPQHRPATLARQMPALSATSFAPAGSGAEPSHHSSGRDLRPWG